MLRFTLKK